MALGGGIEGAERTTRETVSWAAPTQSLDVQVSRVKPTADARANDVMMNDGYLTGAVQIHKDSIVGAHYRLNASPNWRALGLSESYATGWMREFQSVVEARFNTLADSDECWFDASAHNTLTELVRLAVTTTLTTGEVLAVAEWLKDRRRPCKTAIQMVNPDRLTNPMGVSDNRYLKRGVVLGEHGEALSYWISKVHPGDLMFATEPQMWKNVPARKPWGRQQVLHLFEQRQSAQSRGIADIVSVLKQLKMTKQFQDVTLQSAVVAASYAAAIESELPQNEVFQAIGAGDTDPMSSLNKYMAQYLSSMGMYMDNAKNIAIDGAKIPALFPGTKLKILPLGTPGGVGTQYEQSLLRYIASSLNLSYEQFSRDYTQTNYSSARASINETEKGMRSRKKLTADRTANFVYRLWLEEDIALGNIPLPRGKGREWFYEPMVKDALTQCTWIGASSGQIDQVKETNAAILRMDGNLSTLSDECARLGRNWEDVIIQKAREKEMMEQYGITRSQILSISDNNEKETLDEE